VGEDVSVCNFSVCSTYRNVYVGEDVSVCNFSVCSTYRNVYVGEDVSVCNFSVCTDTMPMSFLAFLAYAFVTCKNKNASHKCVCQKYPYRNTNVKIPI